MVGCMQGGRTAQGSWQAPGAPVSAGQSCTGELTGARRFCERWAAGCFRIHLVPEVGEEGWACDKVSLERPAQVFMQGRAA